MFKNQRDCFICTYAVIILNISLQVCSQMRNAKNQPGNIEDILRMVYKNKEQVKDTHGYSYTTSARRNENMSNTQKAALRDVLMMKLVSYYEDKYKLSHRDTVTTESTRRSGYDIFDDKSINDVDLQVVEDNRKRVKGAIEQNEYSPVADNPVAEVITI